MAAQPLIRLIAASVKSNVYFHRGILFQPFYCFSVNQRAVCINRNQQTKLFQFCINLSKVFPEKWFSAGKQQKQHSPSGTGLSQTDPLIRRILSAPGSHFFFRHTDVAHTAVHIAMRRQVKCSFYCLIFNLYILSPALIVRL